MPHALHITQIPGQATNPLADDKLRTVPIQVSLSTFREGEIGSVPAPVDALLSIPPSLYNAPLNVEIEAETFQNLRHFT